MLFAFQIVTSSSLTVAKRVAHGEKMTYLTFELGRREDLLILVRCRTLSALSFDAVSPPRRSPKIIELPCEQNPIVVNSDRRTWGSWLMTSSWLSARHDDIDAPRPPISTRTASIERVSQTLARPSFEPVTNVLPFGDTARQEMLLLCAFRCEWRLYSDVDDHTVKFPSDAVMWRHQMLGQNAIADTLSTLVCVCVCVCLYVCVCERWVGWVRGTDRRVWQWRVAASS